MMYRETLKGSASVCALIAATVPAAALAQERPADETVRAEEEAIVVTGSRIARRDYSANSPIITMEAAAIEDIGAITAEEALNQLPQFVPSNGANSGGGASGQATADLRGLGPKRALVLMDGRRLPPSNIDGSIDLNTIPVALIRNVEVITGGASAVYGSDAVAGVVNFILRRDFHGLELNAQGSITERGDAETMRLGATWGWNFSERGNLVLSFDYSSRGTLFGRDREFYRRTGAFIQIPHGAAVFAPANQPSLATANAVFAQYPGTAPFVNPGPSPRYLGQIGFNDDGTLFSQTVYPVQNFRGEIGDEFTINGTAVNVFVQPDVAVQIPIDRYSGFGRLSYELDNGIELFGQLTYTHYTSSVTSNPVPAGGVAGPLTVSASNPFIPADLRTLLNSRPNPTANFQIAKALYELGPRVGSFDYDVYQVVIGARGELGIENWRWDVFASRGHSDFENRTDHGASRSAIERLLTAPDGGASLCAGGYDIFGRNRPLSDECREFIERTSINRTTQDLDQLQANLQGELFRLPAGPLQFAVGAEYRRSSFDFTPDPLSLTGDLISSTAIQASSGEVSVAELYGELLVPLLRDLPLVEELNVGLGYRYSDYNSIGGVHTYKMDADWRVIPALRLRGGYQRAIRAPSVGELFAPRQNSTLGVGVPVTATGTRLITGDPCDIRGAYRAPGAASAAAVRALCIEQGVPASLVDTFQLPTAAVFGFTGGNPDLEAEKASTYSVGLVVNPELGTPLFRSLSFSVDYYNIEIVNGVGVLTLGTALQRCFNADGTSNPTFSNDNPNCQAVGRRDSTTGFITQGNQTRINITRQQVSGIDAQLDWRIGLDAFGLPADSGAINIGTAISYTIGFDSQTSPTDAVRAIVGTTEGPTPRWKALTTFGYTHPRFSFVLRWRYIDSLRDASTIIAPTSTVPGIAAYNYFDLSARIRIMSNIELRGGINNLTDKEQPILSGVRGFTIPNSYEILGRTFHIGARVTF